MQARGVGQELLVGGDHGGGGVGIHAGEQELSCTSGR
jgi:hypothetical protein